jgi:hypothetical protein
MGASRIRTVRTTSLGLPLLVVALLMLIALPGVAGAVPAQYAWAWAQPYVWQPPALSSIAIESFQALAAGPSGSVYASVDDSTGAWAIARVAIADGGQVWTTPALKTPGGKNAQLAALTSDPQRNAIGAGYDMKATADALVVKVSPAGSVLWQKTWDGPAHKGDAALAVVTDRSGNVYAAGYTEGSDLRNDAVVLKYSPKGVLKWKYVHKTSRWDTFDALGVDAKGNVYVTGSVGNDEFAGDILTMRLSPLGRRVWTRKVTGFGVKYDAYRLRVKGSGVYVAGTLSSPDRHPVVIKYSLAGKQVWAYGNSKDDPINSLAGMGVDPAGRVVLAANAYGLIAADEGLRAVGVLVLTPGGAFDRRGVMDGTFEAGTPRQATGFDLVVDAAGRVYCGGAIDTAAGGASTNAAVTSFPPVADGPWSGPDRIWRYDSPGSGTQDRFWGLLALGDQVFAAGTRDTPGSITGETQPIVEMLGGAGVLR